MKEEVINKDKVLKKKMREIRVDEKKEVKFEDRIINVGDKKMKVEWLRNGVNIKE